MTKQEKSSDRAENKLFAASQLLAILLGFMLALVGIEGGPGFVAFFTLSYSINNQLAHAWKIGKQQLDMSDVFQLYVMPSFSAFLLSWIIAHSLKQGVY